MSPGKGLKKLKSLLSSSLGSNALPSTPPGPAVRQLCRLRFFSLLQECSSRTAPRNADGEQPAQKVAMDGTMESGDLWATRALDYGTALAASSKEVRLDTPLGEEAVDADATAAAALEAIAEAQTAQPDGDDAEAEDVRVRRLKGFEYLLVSMRLQLLDEQKETAEILQEIVQCFQHSAAQLGADGQGWGIRMISGVAAPRFRPFSAHFPPSLARSLRLGARKPGSAKKRRKNGGKRAKNGVETGVSDPYIRMPQPWGAPGAGWAGRAGAERRWRCRGCRVSRPCCAAGEENPARRR